MDSCGSPEETDHYLKNKTMDGDTKSPLGSKESINDQRQSSKDNTEYLPTRCRITKPTPPKPAANPMQFVKIGPCELFRKAQQQIKKVEDVKTVRQEIRDEAEDWQANLDNWKSSRRKRQEHIIERVVEVKKFEQQEQEKGRRKSKTFNEILEERSKRKTKLSISLYEDNSNDFSDLGIGVTQSSNEPKSSKSDDNSNLANEFPKSNSDYSNVKIEDNSNNLINIQEHTENENELGYKQNYNTTETIENTSLPGFEIKWNENYKPEIDNTQNESEHTYESAIQGYRTRVSKTNLNTLPSYPSEQKTDNKTDPNVVIVPKGSILKRKKLFENDKLYEFNHYESNSSRRLSGDFAHSQSLKDRLLSLEKFTEQPLTNCLDTSQSTVNENSDIKNNNTSKSEFVRSRILMINNRQETDKPDSFDSYTDDKIKTVISNNWNKNLECVSPETNVFVRKFENNNLHHRSLDNLTDTTSESMPLDRVQSLEGLDYCHSNYPASNSSTELLILSSQYGDTDREDSGIHTADVSCSVSQADEPVEDSEITATVVVNMDKACIIDEPLITCASSQSGEYSSVDGSIQIMSPVSTECNLYTLDFSGVFVGEDFPLTAPVTVLEPPKEKPPPPPITEDLNESEKRRLNSTTRIKKELHMKRSSFLGIHSCDPPEVDASIRKPPNINSFLQKESRLEKQLYKKNQSSYSEAGDSQDSGIELERGRLSSDTWCSSLPECPVGTGIVHSRQNSEPCTTNSITSEEDEIAKKEREIIELVEKEEKWRHSNEFSPSIHYKDRIELAQNVLLTKSSEELYDQAVAEYATSEDDHSEVLRVEHELLQLEREELQRQRENMIFRESRAHLQQSNTCLKNKRLSLEDISLSSSSSNKPHTYNMFQNDAMEYRKSMPELQRDTVLVQPSTMVSRSAQVTPIKNARPILRETYEQDNFVSRNNNTVKKDIYQQPRSSLTNQKSNHPTSRHSLQLLSAAPRSRLTPQDNWVQLKQNVTESREKFNYNQHWLIQEAEQRRLSDQQKFTAPLLVQNWKLTKSEKHLPDSVIQTLTQRVQNKISLSERNLLGRRLDTVPLHYGAHSPHSVGHALPIIHHPHLMVAESQDKILSVSGKKKCSYCGNELGRGAAMIIESLCLFYHMDCFKCCVCHMQLGDGLMGTDVRVRNNKLHCHNCYSSDDGVKFSCV